MGTNFYLGQAPCDHCARADTTEPRHIGKSSGGWCFALRVYLDLGIVDLPDWIEAWSQPGSIISDEYGAMLTPGEMQSVIMIRSWNAAVSPPHFYASWAEFHAINHSVPGPNGLVRCAIGSHCVKHGDGTWDCIAAEFD